jgi:hypothetical protein
MNESEKLVPDLNPRMPPPFYSFSHSAVQCSAVQCSALWLKGGIGHIWVKVGVEKISLNFCHRELIFSEQEPNIEYYP